MSWRNTLGQRLRRMTPEQASASLRRIQLRVGIAEQPEVLRLTGLRPARLRPYIVEQVCEKLAERARTPAPHRDFNPTEQVD